MSAVFEQLTIESARTSDPRSSHLTVQSVIADMDLHALILDSARSLSWRERFGVDGETVVVITSHDRPVTDTEVWERIEAMTGRRFQRNVIARARGRLEREGRLVRVPDIIQPNGRPMIAFVPGEGQ